MPYAERQWRCPDCGRKHRRRAPKDFHGRCRECCVEWSLLEQRQMHEHSGYHYVRWAWISAAYYNKLLKTITADEARRVA